MLYLGLSHCIYCFVILFPFFPLLALILQGLTETSLFLGLCFLLGEMAYLGALIVLCIYVSPSTHQTIIHCNGHIIGSFAH